MVHFEKKCPDIKTNIFVPLWLPFTTLLLKYKPIEKKKPILETWNANDVIAYCLDFYDQIKLGFYYQIK